MFKGDSFIHFPGYPMIVPTRSGAVVTAVLASMVSWSIASAGSLESTVRRNVPVGLFPVMTYGRNDCGSYPVKDLAVTVQPKHGTVTFVKGPYTLGEETGACRGTEVIVPWLVYQPARDYVGPDSVSIYWKWTVYDNGTSMRPAEKDFAITVK